MSLMFSRDYTRVPKWFCRWSERVLRIVQEFTWACLGAVGVLPIIGCSLKHRSWSDFRPQWRHGIMALIRLGHWSAGLAGL